MIIYSIIQKSQLEGAHRLDAEYYQPEYLEITKSIEKVGFVLLANISNLITDGDHGNPEYSNEGIPYITSKDINELIISHNEANKVSNSYALKVRKDCFSVKNDVLITTVGKIGLSTINDTNEKIILSRDIARIQIKESNNFLPEYISVFFNSDIGKMITLRESVGTIQQGLYLNAINNLKIPKISLEKQNEIKNLFLGAKKHFFNSRSLYSQAENLLLEELGLRDFKIEDDLFYIVNLSEVKSAHRADAEYFQPKYEKIFDFMKLPIKKLGDITKFLNHAKQPPYVDDGEIPIITQRHLGNTFLNLEAVNEPDTKFTSADWLKKYPKYQLKLGDVLYYSVGAYIGKTNIIFENLKATAASFITIIRPTEEVDPVYLTVVLNSIVGQLQSEKWQSATAQQYIYPKDIKNFKIPILPKSTQQKIADLVQKSHESRKRAKQLLEQAKSKVEDLIENK